MADLNVGDIPPAPSGYNLIGKKLMVHDPAAPHNADTVLYPADVLTLGLNDYGINATVPIPANTMVRVEALYKSGATAFATAKFIASRNNEGAVAITIREKDFSAEFADILVKTVAGGFAVEPKLKVGDAAGNVRLSIVPFA